MSDVSTRLRPATDQLGDAELMRRSLREPERFEAVFSRHVRAIFAFASARVGPDRAEDVTAETFAAAFRSRANFDTTASSARPWLYGIAANTLRRHHEHEARWLRRDGADAAWTDDADLDASDERVDAGRLAPRLVAALELLTPGERDVLLLHVLGDLDHDQVARALDIRRGTVKSRLSRGRARLRATFPDLVDHLDQPRTGERRP
jgi:RNA polymerase sigma-70 factor (ECF subfamily)